MIDVDGQFRRALRYEKPFDREIYTIPIRGDVLVEFRQGDWAILYRLFQDLLLGQLSFTRESDLVSIDEEDENRRLLKEVQKLHKEIQGLHLDNVDLKSRIKNAQRELEAKRDR